MGNLIEKYLDNNKKIKKLYIFLIYLIGRSFILSLWLKWLGNPLNNSIDIEEAKAKNLLKSLNVTKLSFI